MKMSPLLQPRLNPQIKAGIMQYINVYTNLINIKGCKLTQTRSQDNLINSYCDVPQSYKTVLSKKFEPHKQYLKYGSNTFYTTIKIKVNVIKA